MKKFIQFLAISAIVMASVAACEKYDDSWIKSTVDSLENRISTLENSMKQLSDYQSIKDKINSGKYISGYKQNADGSYTITFSDNSTITIKDGANGAKGDQGVQGEKGDKGEKGDTGATGATGANGADGIPGATPSFKIENETWYVSYDDGANWSEVGSAIDRSLFSGVVVEDECVKLTLADGSVVVIPIGEKKVIGMEIDESDIIFATDPEAYVSNKWVVPFTLTGDIQNPRIYCNAQVVKTGRGVVLAEVVMNEDGKSGKVVISREMYQNRDDWDYQYDYYPEARISLVTFNGDGQSCMREIKVLGEFTQYDFSWFGDDYGIDGLDYKNEVFYAGSEAIKDLPLRKMILIDLGDSGLTEKDLCINMDYLNEHFPVAIWYSGSFKLCPVLTDVEFDSRVVTNTTVPYIQYSVNYYYDVLENTTSNNISTKFQFRKMLTSSVYESLNQVTLVQQPL